MYYPEELIEEVRQKNDIVDVISGYIGLQRKGSNYVCCCPFHSEKTPSFAVSRSRQIYKCFGCGEGGNVVTFVMKYENCTFPEAIKILADKAGVELPQMEYSEEARRREARRARLLEVNKEAAKFYYYQLRTPHGEKAREYLDGRRLTEETRRNFGLGYAPVRGGELITYLRQKGYSDDLIRDVGLAKTDEKRGTTTQFWNRVMFPIMDVNNRVIGFGGRVLGDGTPKYLNSPDSVVFNKSRNLFALNLAKNTKLGRIILTEGYMDTISLVMAGFENVVASMGTSLTKDQARALAKAHGFCNAEKKDSQDICFVPDGDYAAAISRYTGRTYPAGNFVSEEGRVLGRHKGHIHYTVGQRKGLGLSFGEPMYVCEKRAAENEVVLSRNDALFAGELEAEQFNWIAIDPPASPIHVAAKIRYNQTEQPATVTATGADRAHIVFDKPQRAIAKGQSVVLYDGDYVIGGGIIL